MLRKQGLAVGEHGFYVPKQANSRAPFASTSTRYKRYSRYTGTPRRVAPSGVRDRQQRFPNVRIPVGDAIRHARGRAPNRVEGPARPPGEPLL